ncbi:hybrid signal transduction histidine kinase M [Tanacetum coccineum]
MAPFHSLRARLVVARPKTTRKAWDLVADIVKDNKRSHSNALKAELRFIKLRDQSMESYFQKINSIITILTSLDVSVNEEVVVHYAIDGLPETYNSGSCRYGDSCQYAHDANARVSITNSGINKGRGTSDNITHDLLNKLLTQLGNLGMNVAMSQNGTVPNSTTIASNNTASPGNSLGPHVFFASPNPSPGPNITAPPGFPPMAQAHVPTYFTAANNTNQAHVTPSTTTGLVMQPTGYVSHALGPVMQSGAGTNSGQATLLPQAFIAGTLHDP